MRFVLAAGSVASPAELSTAVVVLRSWFQACSGQSICGRKRRLCFLDVRSAEKNSFCSRVRGSILAASPPRETAFWLSPVAIWAISWDYRRRRSIECLFQTVKGRGFHLEQTGVIEPYRLCRLFGLLTLAHVLCVCIGESLPQWICKSTKRAHKSVAHASLAVAHRVALWLLGPPSDLKIRRSFQARIPGKA